MTLLECCEKYNKVVKNDIKNGLVWVYSNHGCSGTFAAAKKKNNLKANCATLANWCLREMGILNTKQYFYSKEGGTIAADESTMKALKKRCEVIHLGRYSITKAIKEGKLQAGDIVCHYGQHTNIYAGGDVWYDSGHYNCVRDGEDAPFRKQWKCHRNDGGELSHIIRPKIRMFRVRVAKYSDAETARAESVHIFETLGIASFVEGTSLYAGSFTIEANAKQRQAQLVANGYKRAKVLEVWV